MWGTGWRAGARDGTERRKAGADPVGQLRGKLLARCGEREEGEGVEAGALAGGTDMLNMHAGALVDLADVLALAGRDLRPELERALALYEQKGNLVMAERTREMLAVS
jgi:hypothetical protein